MHEPGRASASIIPHTCRKEMCACDIPSHAGQVTAASVTRPSGASCSGRLIYFFTMATNREEKKQEKKKNKPSCPLHLRCAARSNEEAALASQVGHSARLTPYHTYLRETIWRWMLIESRRRGRAGRDGEGRLGCDRAWINLPAKCTGD